MPHNLKDITGCGDLHFITAPAISGGKKQKEKSPPFAKNKSAKGRPHDDRQNRWNNRVMEILHVEMQRTLEHAERYGWGV